MWLTSSSVGRKLVMAITGAFLILFVTFHALMNGVALFWPTAYNVVCEFLGANWYALLGGVVLAAGIIIHIIYAIWLTIQNRNARGHERYNVTSRPPQVEWSSKNMLVLGFVVLAFLVLHLIQFWAKMQLFEICEMLGIHTSLGQTMTTPCGMEMAVPAAAGTFFLQQAFSCWITLAVYIVAFVALWFHLTHGFWSMFQSCGWNGRTWLPRLKKAANWFTTIIIALFIAEAVVFFVRANQDYYTTDKDLVMQYIEMAQTADGETAAPALIESAAPCAAAPCAAADCLNPACDNAGNCADCPQAPCNNETINQ